MPDTDVAASTKQPAPHSQVKLPWELMDAEEGVAPTSAAGGGVVFRSLPRNVMAAEIAPEEQSPEDVADRAFFPDDADEPPVLAEIDTDPEISPVSSDAPGFETPAPAEIQFADVTPPAEVPLSSSDSPQATVSSAAQADAVPERIAIHRELPASASIDETAATFAMTDSVLTAASEVATTAESLKRADRQRTRDDDAMLAILAADDAAEIRFAAPRLPVQPLAATEPELELERLAPALSINTGGGWTIPLMCLGIGLIACCVAIPQSDYNRRLAYERQSLQANLESIQKQVAVNNEFLKKVMDDPALAERLASRQMKTIRKGQKILQINQVSQDTGMTPFALVAVARPQTPAAYAPVTGTIANWCNDARSRLYLMGAAMTMVAVGLVMSFSPGKVPAVRQPRRTVYLSRT